MVVLLVIVTFAVFIAIDLLLSRHKVPVAAAEALEAERAAVGQEVLSGFHVPANLSSRPHLDAEGAQERSPRGRR